MYLFTDILNKNDVNAHIWWRNAELVLIYLFIYA